MKDAEAAFLHHSPTLATLTPERGIWGAIAILLAVIAAQMWLRGWADPGACHDCGGDIAKGEYHRSRSDIADGELMSFRWCAECCAAQAASWEDDGEAWEARVSLGHKRRGYLRGCAV